ncbi:MAG: glycosyltransferase family 1 protein [Deltaproteobacteria bacterium]|nr:glycosyltransferase family 1 protein [Deltaproteobacteria bacterium]
MRVVLAPVGSRGDVQPFLALGRGLMARGHQVLVVVSENYRAWIEGIELPYAYGGRDLESVLHQLGEGIFNPISFLKTGALLARESGDALLAAARAFRPEVIVGGGLAVCAPSVAELIGARLYWASFFPGTHRTGEYAFPLFGLHTPSRALNRMSWFAGELGIDLVARRIVNGFRRDHQLIKVGPIWKHLSGAGPVLLATDPAVAGAPRDWTITSKVTGYWFLDDLTPLDSELEAFLEAGPPPIYVGFGSMPVEDAKTRVRTIVDGVERAGARAILSAGWAKLGDSSALPSSVKKIGPVSHALLFPRVSCAIHHCGAGTTGAVIRAGVPHIPVPHGFDQFDWAAKLESLGVATPRLEKGFTSAELCQSIRATSDDRLRKRARALGELVRATDGVGTAVAYIERAPGA